ncbi:MAG: 1-(5-phosphoribosyl)-5-[(5-phosphoribosylamino)methylideneamino] imidazole-4-carboxamide isomerase [Candidatus Dormibacteraeota bacterium]|nr:1-(5-phosphoribosyl)-5-[(5-phosphoribosylamino)methylideneamino] imidazole-4-carboxamide isomerase [Candidatus Dormibacteraeota bacterium]
MEVIPAIDVRGGCAVRLVEGDFERETVYGDDPLRIALGHAAAGARRLHVVDLDAAATRGDNRAVVARLVAESGLSVQVAGGVRSEAQAGEWLAAGAAAVVVGTVAVREPALFARMARTNPGRVMAALDMRAGRPAVSGWTESESVEGAWLLEQWSDLELGGVILTAVDRDGTLAGPDLDLLRQVQAWTRHPLTYSGGIGSLADLQALSVAGAAGVIVGKSIYEGTIDLAAAIDAVN